MFREYLKLVENNILEGGKGSNVYNDMFKDYMSDPKVASKIKEYISWANKNLKKTDRIVWFLRWIKVELAGLKPTGSIPHKDRLKAKTEIDVARQTEMDKINKRLSTNFFAHESIPIKNLQTQLEHFLSLPVPQIQNTQWSTQSPVQLLSGFKELEKEWQDSSSERNQIKYEEGNEPEKIIDFGDGYAWFDLEKSSCDQEARAMGHCGNSAANDGTVLSLRKLVNTTGGTETSLGHTYWYPVLTFILDDNNELGEMKGRNNDKPIEKYHPYIVALLKSYRIEGIKGGGYMPEHNFNMSDLDDNTRDELIELKPDLGGVDYMYSKEGMTSRVESRIERGLEARNLPTRNLRYEKENERFIVNEWSDFEQFISGGVYDDTVEKILKIALGEEDKQQDADADMNKLFSDTVLQLPEDWQRKIITRSGLPHPSWASSDEIVAKATQRLIQTDDEYFQMFQHALLSGQRIRDEAWERLFMYAESGWGYASFHVYDNIPTDNLENFKKFVTNEDTVYLYLSEQDLVYYASADDDDEEHSPHELNDGNGNGYDWENVNYDNRSERRGHYDDNLEDKNGNDLWLKTANTSSALEDEFLAALQGSKYNSRINDPNQEEMKFQESLRRMREIAGIKTSFVKQQKIRL